MAEAREALRAARLLLDGDAHTRAVSDAYYGMLYAARAALSERDRNAKTHKGTWDLFWLEFVEAGSFDRALAAEARQTQDPREGVDYEALSVDRTEAERIATLAVRFIDAVAATLQK